MGPFLVHKSMIEDAGDLRVETRVNGELRQSGSTEDMIFPIADMIETLSKGMTLEAGILSQPVRRQESAKALIRQSSSEKAIKSTLRSNRSERFPIQ